MMRFPVCYATTAPACSQSQAQPQPQIFLHAGVRSFSHLRKVVDCRGISRERVIWVLPSGSCFRKLYFKTRATKLMISHVLSPGASGSTKVSSIFPCSNELDGTGLSFSDDLSDSIGKMNMPFPMGKGNLNHIENSSISSLEDGLLNISGQVIDGTNILKRPVIPDTMSTINARIDIAPENPISVSDSLDVAGNALYKLKTSILEFLSEFTASIDDSVDKGDHTLNNTLNSISSSMKYSVKNVTEAIDSAVNNMLSTVNRTEELAGSELTGFSGDIKEAMSRGGGVFVDTLRRTLVSLEDYLARGTAFIVYYYMSAKELLPPDVLDVVNINEEKAIGSLRPVRSAFGQVYIAIEVLERNLGLDSSDPVLQFFLFLGTSTILGITYRVLNYGGYSGDLSPKLTLETLTTEKNVVLIDVRPEELRERNGVPDLRRGARFKYANVSLPKINGSVKDLVKSGVDVDDALVAAVIRNLKIVQDNYKVIILDADGTRSKGIARFLRKLGVKKPYLVQGGFQSWVKSGLRVKELKPETTLTILNEEAEAILEDIRPSPVQVVFYGVGSIAAIYALFEWEKTLELVGIIGIAQTIYRRVASYKDSEDFKRDIRLLLAPVRLGTQAISWAAGKLEPSRMGLPTSPSSSDVQNKVLLAAAKHESQPCDTEESQDSVLS